MNNSSGDDLRDMKQPWEIDFEKSDMLILPQLSFADHGKETSPSGRLAIYSRNQSINGTIHLMQNEYASNISVCLSSFNLSNFLEGMTQAGNISRKKCATVLCEACNNSNRTICAGRTRFEIKDAENAQSGMYTAYVTQENSSTVLYAKPLLIAEGEIILQMPDRVTSVEPFIPIKMNVTAPENHSKFFVAIMIASGDYENISLSLSDNETTGWPDLILSVADKSLKIPHPPRVSSGLLMDMLPLLPQNSAIGLQESVQPGVDVVLMTDRPWEKGEHILTCAAYSPAKGLLGIKQSKIEII